MEQLAQDYQSRLTVGKINIDEQMKIAEKYQIMTIPTLILFQDGNAGEPLAVSYTHLDVYKRQVWVASPPSTEHALAGATLIVNLSASDEVVGKDTYRQDLARGQSARLLCGYVYSSAGDGESTTDVVYSGHNLIAENGIVLAESPRFSNQTIWADLDVHRLMSERRRLGTFQQEENLNYVRVKFHLKVEETALVRMFDANPFVPSNKQDRDKRCQDILSIQAGGLKKRLLHTNCKSCLLYTSRCV